MAHNFQGWAAQERGGTLVPYEYSMGDLGPEQVQVRVESCGICRSDLAMIDNSWSASVYPLVPGHEVIGVVEEVGALVKGLTIGQRVGIGWFAGSCMSCLSCLTGRQNLCRRAEQTVVKRPGGFADRIRCQATWAVPLPAGLNASTAGPLFCAGITVFAPLLKCNVLPIHRVGVIGIGGLGHLAVQFLAKWGCRVTAFTSSERKVAECLKLGAHEVIQPGDTAAMRAAAGKFNFILSTVDVPLNWQSYLDLLSPDGTLHFVGAVLDPVSFSAPSLIGGRKRISGSPVGSPAETIMMLEFCERHGIRPRIETFPLSNVNDALAYLRAGNAKYRVVLEMPGNTTR